MIRLALAACGVASAVLLGAHGASTARESTTYSRVAHWSHAAAQAGRPLPAGLPPTQAAHALQVAIRHHRAVAFDANVEVEFLKRTRNRHLITEFTSVPLIYSAKPTNPREKDYFRVVGFRLKTVRVRLIPKSAIVGIKSQHWDTAHPHVSVLTHRGIVRTDNAGHVPAVRVRLGNGRLLEVPVGLTGIDEA